MARKKSKSSTRDATPTSLGPPPALSNYNHLRNPFNITPRPAIPIDLDRRLFRPDESTRPPTTHSSLASRVVLKIITVRQKRRQFHAKIDKYTNPFHYPKTYLRTRLGFSVSRRVETCIRRKIRKEVIFAKRKNGKGGQRKPRRNFWSAIACSRR